MITVAGDSTAAPPKVDSTGDGSGEHCCGGHNGGKQSGAEMGRGGCGLEAYKPASGGEGTARTIGGAVRSAGCCNWSCNAG